METEAKKAARDRWNERNPTLTLRLPQERYDALKQAAKEMNIGGHGLLKQIVLDWLEKENR